MLRIDLVVLFQAIDRDRQLPGGHGRLKESSDAPASACCDTVTHRYTIGMKTAISLPDAVFHAAERQARRAQKSRSQLYSEALSEYLSRHSPDEVTDAMNHVVDQLSPGPDASVSVAAQSVLARSEW